MLNANELALLTKGLKLKRDELNVQAAKRVHLVVITDDGKHHDVSGTVTVGEDYSRLATVEIPMLRAMAALVAGSGCVGPAVANRVMQAIGDAMEQGTDKARALNELCNDIESAMATVRENLSKHLPQQTVRGAVTVKATTVQELSAIDEACLWKMHVAKRLGL